MVETRASAASFFEAILSPIAAMAPGVRPDEGDARRGERLGKVGALGEEAVAGMDRVGARRLRQASMILSMTRYEAEACGGPICDRLVRGRDVEQRRGRRRCRRRPWRCRAAARSWSRGRRSRRGWRSGSSGTSARTAPPLRPALYGGAWGAATWAAQRRDQRSGTTTKSVLFSVARLLPNCAISTAAAPPVPSLSYQSWCVSVS